MLLGDYRDAMHQLISVLISINKRYPFFNCSVVSGEKGMNQNRSDNYADYVPRDDVNARPRILRCFGQPHCGYAAGAIARG